MKTFMIGYIFLLSIAFFVLAFFLGSIWLVGSYLFIALSMLLWGIYELRSEMIRRKEKEIEESKKLLKQISHTKFTLSEDLLHGLLIDESKNNFHVAKRQYIDVEFQYKTFPFSKLLEVAIIEDGKIKSIFPMNGILGGTIKNNGVSPIVNFNQSEEVDVDDESDDEETVKKLTLKLIIDDFSHHTVEYVFLEKEEPIEKDSEEYNQAFKACTNWYQMISLIINQYKHEKRLVGPWV